MIDTLYVNGCSWTAGDEIEKDIKFEKYLIDNKYKLSKMDNWTILNELGDDLGPISEHRHKFNWGSVVSKKLNIKNYINQSVGGASNDKIIRETIDFVLSYPKENLKNLLLIIGWTASDRKEIFIKETNTFERFNTTTSFMDSLPMESKLSQKHRKKYNKYHELYLDYVFDYYECVKRKTQQIYCLSNILENLKVKYLFFNSIQSLNEIYDFTLTREFDNFFDWYKKNQNIFSDFTMQYHLVTSNCPVGEFKHPLIDGHEIWGDFLIKIINERKLLWKTN